MLTASALGYASTLAGCVAEALPLLERVLEEAERAGCLAEQALTRTQQERGHEAWALRLLGEMAAQRQPPVVEPADGYYHQALTLVKELGMRPLQAHCHHGLGTLYAKTGQAEQARTALMTAIDLYRAMDMTCWLPKAEVALAQVEER